MFNKVGNILNSYTSVVKSDSKKDNTTIPNMEPQINCEQVGSYTSAFGPFIPTSTVLGGIFGKVAKKAGEIAAQVKDRVVDEVTNFDTQHKINEAKVIKLLIDNHTFNGLKDAYDSKDIINEIAKHDYKQVEAKYKAIQRNLETEGVNHEDSMQRTKYLQEMSIYALAGTLTYDKIDESDINRIFEIRRNRNPKNTSNELSIRYFVNTLKCYDNFDLLSARAQKDLMTTCSFNFLTHNSLTLEEANNISEYSSLMKFDYIRDLKAVNSKEEFVNNLQERRKNIPCKAIKVENNQLEKVLSNDGINQLENSLKNTDLTKYKNGLPLEYSRNDYIKDFQELTKDLSNEDKKKVFDTFQFKINSAGDIVSYPNPNIDIDNVDESIKDVVKQGKELTNKFMLKNKIKLAPEDKALEDSMNDIIKAFPEFVSVIGKAQHRGDSIDNHTLDDLQRIYNNEEYQQLPDTEKRILTLATLFHDFGKEQGVVDEGHARKSAISTKEIIKKTNLSFDEKERVFNLVNHSHWLTDGSSNEDVAFVFRRPNDFKMAEIFEKADSNSAGFPYEPDSKKIEEIKKNIDFINTNGIPLFADNLPSDESLYDRTESGIKYLDFRDPEASVEKYGYPAGTKVKDLKFLCHSSNDNKEDFEALCDDSKEVCLSTSLLDVRNKFSTGYNGAGSYIVSGNNANIIVGGKNVSCTGGHRGYNYAKDTSFLRASSDGANGMSSAKGCRPIIPNQIKENLKLSDSEYIEMYNSICNLKNLEDVQDIKLSTGRTIVKEEIQKEISNIQKEMVRPKEEGEGGYTNEFVVYNPKIEAQVLPRWTPEQLENHGDKNTVYVLT